MVIEAHNCRVMGQAQESRHRKRKMSSSVISFQLLAAVTAKAPFSFVLLLCKMSPDNIYKEIQSIYQKVFLLIDVTKCCQTFSYVDLKQFSSFSKSPNLARNFFYQVCKCCLQYFFKWLKIGMEIFCALPRDFTKYFKSLFKNFTFDHCCIYTMKSLMFIFKTLSSGSLS